MNKVTIIKWLGGILTIITIMILILYITPYKESGNLSGKMANIISNGLDQYSPHSEISESKIEFMVRKFAHFIVYFLFATVVFIIWQLLCKSRLFAYLLTFAVTVPIPYLDEWIQSFTKRRSSTLLDVWIDLFGIGVAIFAGTLYLIKSVLLRKGK